MADAKQRLIAERFPGQGIIYDRAGMPVDATGWVWRMNALSPNKVIDFTRMDVTGGEIFTSIVRFMAERIKVVGAVTVHGNFNCLVLLNKSKIFAEALQNDLDLDRRFFDEMRALNDFDKTRLAPIRQWYRWCAKQGFPHFSRETARELDDLVIGGNEKGRAVRTRDPLRGAFDDIEFGALHTKLRAIGPTILTALELALVWLMVALGRNAFAYALMREDDYRPVPEKGSNRIYHAFAVPRIKQREAYLRSGFDPVMFNHEVGSAIAALIKENREGRADGNWPDGCAFPLFPRTLPQPSLMEGPLHEFAMHMTGTEITSALQAAVDKLKIVSHRTGEPLRIDARRFRRTFATRGVEKGMSPGELAVALGHTDLQNVNVYFETRSSQVDRLDAALAKKLGPIADAFMGRIVDDEADAINGNDPTKRIPWFRRKFGNWPESNGDLGTCGSGPCDLLAPISCYTCPAFQPWKAGPHKEMLDWLCEERERKQKAGFDPEIVGLHDATILAVGKVVAACEGDAA